MAQQKVTYLSILLVFLLNPLYAQTGAGCIFKNCPTAGQVRIDTVFNANGQFVRGCNCACDPAIYEVGNPKYCGTPRFVNFNPNTLMGDCSCECANAPLNCAYPQVYLADQCECGCASVKASCAYPLQWKPELCQCGCEIGSVSGPCIRNGVPVSFSRVNPDCTCYVECLGNQEYSMATGLCDCPAQAANGAFFPTCHPPLKKDPVTCDCFAECIGNQQYNAVSGVCDCPARALNGAFFPICQYPLQKDPVTCDCIAAAV